MSTEKTEIAPGITLTVEHYTTRYVEVALTVIAIDARTVTIQIGNKHHYLRIGEVLKIGLDQVAAVVLPPD